MIDRYLQHHGVLGMHWGIRRFQNKDGTLTDAGKARLKSNESNHLEIIKSKDGKIQLHEQKTPDWATFLGKVFPSLRKKQNLYRGYDIKDSNGEIIGDLQVEDQENGRLYINWITVDRDQRGKGYATSTINTMINDAKQKGFNEITLEVPTNSPDARHIYEKLGFKATQETQIDPNDILWGGLTSMKLDLTQKDRLKHHGILGMHWGIRRYQNEDGSLTPAGQKRREERDQKWVKKNYNKIYGKAYKSFQKELKRNRITEITPRNQRRIPKSTLNAYNKEMARIMNDSVGNLAAPSGQVVRFIAKRGEVGVHMALASAGYDVQKEFKNGIWGSGRIAYRKNEANKMRI